MTSPLQCPRCSGPAVRIEQSGALHCANQCDETDGAREARLELQRLTARIAHALGPAMPKGVGFVLLLADYEVGGMGYASSLEREGVISLLQEMADKMRKDADVAAHLVNTTIANAVRGGGS